MTDAADQLTEQILVLRCQAGDEKAFELIVARYGARLRYYLLKLVGSPEAAEDLMQDVWLDVYRGIARLREPAAFRAWIYRIARDRAYRLLRRTRPPRQLMDGQELVVDEAQEVEFAEEDARRIHLALDTLSPDHREVLLLRFIDDLSYTEIADITGCGMGTVKSRIHYAKQMLRRAIERESDDD